MKKLSLVFVLLLLFALFVNSTSPAIPRGVPLYEISSTIKLMVSDLGTPAETGTIIFTTDDKYFLSSRLIANTTGALPEEQICLSLGPLDNENWDIIKKGQVYGYVGEQNIGFNSYVLCDLQKNLSQDLKQINNQNRFNEEYFSHCGLETDSEQVMCLVVFSDEDLEIGISPPSTSASDNFSSSLPILFILLIPFAIAFILSVLFLSKTIFKKLKYLYSAKVILYSALFLTLFAQLLQVNVLSFIMPLFIGNILFQPVLSFISKDIANEVKDPQVKLISITKIIEAIYIFLFVFFIIFFLPLSY